MNRRVLAAALALLAGACGHSIIGGRCIEGYVPAPGGGCTPAADGGFDAGGDDRDGGGGDPDGGPPNDRDGGPGDARPPVCDPGLARCDDSCVDTAADPAHCGGCGRSCGAAEVCSRGTCVPQCVPPLVACGRACVDLNTDENHCGACGGICPTGICNAGVCRGARAGHLVLIGHGFERTRPDQDRVLGNAVFLNAPPTARVLAYAEYADTTAGGAVANVDAAITTVASGRAWTRTRLSDRARISVDLSIDRYDVVLVYAQPLATDDVVAAIARDCGDSIRNFVRAGGVAIVLDGGPGNRGTYPVANATGLLNITGSTSIDGRLVDLAAPTDALVVGASTSYRAEYASVRFATSDPYSVYEESAHPVVLHRAVVPER